VDMAPEAALARSDMGRALFELGRHGEALEAIDGAVRLEPKGATWHKNRSVVLRALGRDRESLDAKNLAARLGGDRRASHA